MKRIKSFPKKMLCTDLDGTFIGNDSSMYEVLRMLDNDSILLVFSTGRHLPSVETFINEKGIRKPDACILMVGTEIYLLSKGKFVLDKYWSRIISQDWDRERIVQLLIDINELVQQDEEWQTKFKLSYFLRKNQDGVLQEVNQRLQRTQIKARVIYSGNQFLDLLPLLSGKAEAVKYVADTFKVRTENVVVCGDSGNDLDMFKAGFRGIIVGNAYAELGNFDGENAYHAIREYSAGILEGLYHFNFI